MQEGKQYQPAHLFAQLPTTSDLDELYNIQIHLLDIWLE